MKGKYSAIIAAALIFTVISFSNVSAAGQDNNRSTMNEDVNIQGCSGMVRFVDRDGGYFLIVTPAEDGGWDEGVGDQVMYFEPVNLNKEFQHDGMCVKFWGKHLTTGSPHEGAPVEIVMIEKGPDPYKCWGSFKEGIKPYPFDLD